MNTKRKARIAKLEENLDQVCVTALNCSNNFKSFVTKNVNLSITCLYLYKAANAGKRLKNMLTGLMKQRTTWRRQRIR